MSIAMPSVEPHQYGRPVTAGSPRLKHEGLSNADRNVALAMHLSPFAGLFTILGFFAPLVLWLVRKDESSFADDHGREVLNFWISFVILSVCIGILAFPTLGLALVLYPVHWVVTVISMVRGAIAANNGEYFRYPITIRVIT